MSEAAPPPCPPLPAFPPLSFAFNRRSEPRPEQAERGIPLVGDGRRLRLKLRSGLPISIAAVGASNFARGGCLWQLQGNRTRCSQQDVAGADEETGLAKGWLLQAFQAIQRTWPHPAHRLHNSGIGARHADSFTHCFNRFVPDDADALIIGFSEMCDGKHHTIGFKTQTFHQGFVGVETLMRIALSRPDPPALLLFSHYRFGCGKGGKLRCNFEAQCDSQLTSLAQWYHASVLSMRNALYHDASNSVYQDLLDGKTKSNPYYHKSWSIDGGVHLDLHKGDRMIAELVYSWVRRLVERSAPISGRDMLGRMPGPLGGNPEISFGSSICFDFAEAVGKVGGRAPSVVRAHGWEYVTYDRGMENGAIVSKYKPGMKTTSAKSVLELDTTIGTTRSHGGGHDSDGKFRLGYLQTYSSNATAALTCVAPCTCGSHSINAHSKARTSLTTFTPWIRFSLSQQKPCVLRLELLTEGELFKVIALHVASYAASIRAVGKQARLDAKGLGGEG